jgi:hypothetical protein
MSVKNEYRIDMKSGLSAAVLFACMLLIAVLCVAPSHAQVNGTPSSVTSLGVGGRPVNGPPASVTSVGPAGYAPRFRTGTPGTVPFQHGRGDNRSGDNRSGDGQHRHHHDDNSGGAVFYAVPVPYAVDAAPEGEGYPNEANSNDAYPADEAEHQGGPTVFDRRGSGERSYVPPAKEAAPRHQADRDDVAPPEPPPEPEPLQPTVLVFKDGHTVEVGNYAIVGPTLMDLTRGHSRKIPLTDLDLEATRKQNDDRGVTFQVPPPPKTPIAKAK